MISAIKFTFLLAIIIFNLNYDKSRVYTVFNVNNQNFTYKGRIEKLNNAVVLIGPASSITTKVIGTTCEIYLKNEANQNNYVSVEVDGNYEGRIRIDNDSLKPYKIELNANKKEHIITIYKATEASTGDIIFGGLLAEKIEKVANKVSLKIEFIGDSITSAAASDIEEIPCGNGSQYYDHSNAYFSYGTIIGRKLNADILLSAVSGIGIYRNWNAIQGEEPIMPEVYENLYLNMDNSKPYDFTLFTPDIVSICLGTNDFSNGDGIKERLPFNEEVFTNYYIDFLTTVISKYPKAKIVLLDSPTVKGDRNIILNNSLLRIKEQFGTTNTETSIFLFKFADIVITGCSGHPEREEHKQMAEMLALFLKNIDL